jgi:hypothetical protein
MYPMMPELRPGALPRYSAFGGMVEGGFQLRWPTRLMGTARGGRTVTHYHIYEREADIDVDEVLDSREFDDRLARVVNPLAVAFERSEDLGSSFRHLVADMLRQFLGTHESIRLLLENREKSPTGMADAMSLAPEQVEKVYAVALLLEGPEEWTERYLKDAWRKSYERHLIEAHERHDLPRYADYLDRWSNSLYRERQWLGISDEE